MFHFSRVISIKNFSSNIRIVIQLLQYHNKVNSPISYIYIFELLYCHHSLASFDIVGRIEPFNFYIATKCCIFSFKMHIFNIRSWNKSTRDDIVCVSEVKHSSLHHFYAFCLVSLFLSFCSSSLDSLHKVASRKDFQLCWLIYLPCEVKYGINLFSNV